MCHVKQGMERRRRNVRGAVCTALDAVSWETPIQAGLALPPNSPSPQGSVCVTGVDVLLVLTQPEG